jgi:hypothetical protein
LPKQHGVRIAACCSHADHSHAKPFVALLLEHEHDFLAVDKFFGVLVEIRVAEAIE